MTPPEAPLKVIRDTLQIGSQSQFAKKLGCSQPRLSRYENGKVAKPDLDTLMRFTRVIRDLTISQLGNPRPITEDDAAARVQRLDIVSDQLFKWIGENPKYGDLAQVVTEQLAVARDQLEEVIRQYGPLSDL